MPTSPGDGRMTHTVLQVADHLQVSRDSVERLIHTGALNAINVSTGGRARLRVTQSELDRFIADREIPNVRAPRRIGRAS